MVVDELIEELERIREAGEGNLPVMLDKGPSERNYKKVEDIIMFSVLNEEDDSPHLAVLVMVK
jgi:hypothetical protein